MKPEMKKLIIANLPYLLFVYLFGKLGQTYRLAAGADLSEKLLHLADGFSLAFESAAPSFHLFDLAVGVAGAVALRLMVYCKSKNAKKYRRGVEYGSARWGGPKDIAPYIDPVFDNNILLTQTERLTMNNRPKDPKTARNKNVLVIGGSGSGKTRFFVKPNLMQCVSKDYPTSFVITDPKGSLIGEVGQLLVRCGYRVKVLNTINFSKSMRYNPFRYIHSEKDILKLVNTLICNTKGEGEKSAEDFWIKSERLLYSALIGYIWYEAPDDEMNFTTLLEMINASEAREDDPEFQSPVDQMFERLEEKDPEHFAVRQYRKFLLSAGKTRSSILISCGARLAPFDIREVRELMEDDELELDTIGDKKTALFLIMSDTDTTFNFILAMVQSQLINLLCDRADDKYGGRLPVHVRLILDEFANIGQIPNFDKLIATIRSREISASIILQSQSQLKAIYKDAAEIISDNCDCTLFLSGRGKNAKLKPYRAAAKAERKSIAANAEFAYQKSLRDNPELAQAVKNPVSRFWQKQHIKREYAKAARAAGQTAQGAASTAKTTAAAAKKAAEKSRQAASFAARHWKGALIVGGVGLMLLLVMGGLQSCTAMFGSTGTGLAATSYLSEDSDMLGAEAAYAALEADLQHELDNYESLHPGYDEYRFDLDEIKHDPYVLTSILSALHNGVFTLGEVQGDLAMLFEKQYILTQTIETETRYRTETRTDSEGNTYTVEVPYTYYICNVKLENFDLSHLPIYILTEEQMGFYAAYMQTLGNRPDLFPNGSYPHASTPKEPTYYEIPPEALKDEAFAAMIAEAEKYVGYPYVWGGSSPSTSFDCSGFISWVINHSGWNVGRQTAQGLYNICTPVSPEQAKPGDLVFFVGTYDTAGMSHVGLYVGNSVMLHCGDPISYTNLNSSYWQQHFYCYGRLP